MTPHIRVASSREAGQAELTAAPQHAHPLSRGKREEGCPQRAHHNPALSSRPTSPTQLSRKPHLHHSHPHQAKPTAKAHGRVLQDLSAPVQVHGHVGMWGWV